MGTLTEVEAIDDSCGGEKRRVRFLDNGEWELEGADVEVVMTVTVDVPDDGTQRRCMYTSGGGWIEEG